MARATHIAAIAGHTGDGIAGTITGIGITDLDEALLMRLEIGETPKRACHGRMRQKQFNNSTESGRFSTLYEIYFNGVVGLKN